MAWTEERIRELKVLWSEGQSASKIADKLGGVTRNAVIGKIHRRQQKPFEMVGFIPVTSDFWTV